MRSIRLSLMVYFLALLGVSLLAASLLVYGIAKQTLAAKQQAMVQLIEKQYSERCEKERARLDAELLAQAKSLARLVQVQLDWYRAEFIQPVLLSGLVSSFNPNGYAMAPLWLAEGVPMPPRYGSPPSTFWLIHQDIRSRIRSRLVEIKLDKMLLPADSQTGEFFQIDCPPSKPHYSHSMAGRSFQPPTSTLESDQIVQEAFDDTMLGNTAVRRVVLKASSVDTRLIMFPRRPQDFPPPPPRPRISPSGPRRGPTTIYVHCAATTDKLGGILAGFRQLRDDDFARIASETQDSLRDLRRWLWGISLAVFAATAFGTFGLVRRGLLPLRRLSHAVSQVSVKDFRLPLDGESLPRELRPIAKRLTNTLDLLKRAFAREKQAAADISHELRTPLAALLTTTEFGLRKPRSVEHYRELLSDIHASAQQMNQIVERLLTLARLDAGVDHLRVQAVDVAALARQCADVIRPLAEARELKLTVANDTDAADAGSVQTDPDKLREIVSNLLHNAVQYNRPGGAIDLRVARSNGTLQVEVQDTGIGIADEVRERIFERFYRADPSRGGDDLHAGLGLAIVKEYIDLMGGSIGVDSTEGQGSTFRVRLPVR